MINLCLCCGLIDSIGIGLRWGDGVQVERCDGLLSLAYLQQSHEINTQNFNKTVYLTNIKGELLWCIGIQQYKPSKLIYVIQNFNKFIKNICTIHFRVNFTIFTHKLLNNFDLLQILMSYNGSMTIQWNYKYHNNSL